MKKHFLLTASTAAAFLFAACGDSSSTAGNTDTSAVAMVDTAQPPPPPADMKTPVQTMMDKIKTLRMTGDFDRDFANVMLLNHQEALDISRMAVATAKDPEVQEMAQRMVTDHEGEIAKLKTFVDNHDTTSADHPAGMQTSGDHPGFTHDLNSMMDSLASKPLTGNASKDYVTLMLSHHRNAVQLEQDELQHGDHTELKKMAKEMMADDKKEIAEFELWLKKMKE